MVGGAIRIMDKLSLNRDSFLQRDVLELVRDPFHGAWMHIARD